MKDRIYQVLKWAILVYLLVHIIGPLWMLFSHISFNDVRSVVHSPQFAPMLKNSVLAASVTTVISVCLAILLAYCVNRTNMKHRDIFTVLFTLPMLVPSISHGIGLTLLFGDNGIFTNFTGIRIPLYGLTGIVMGSTLYSFPVAFLMLCDVFRSEDYTVYEAARVLGIPKSRQLTKLTLATLKKPLISTVFAVFTMVFTDYGVPLVVGGKMTTLPVYMYQEVIGLLNYSEGGIIAVFLLMPAVIAFIVDFITKEEIKTGTIIKKFRIEANKKRDMVSYVFSGAVLLIVNLPILIFVFLSLVKQYPVDLSLSFDNISRAFDLGVTGYLLNSLFISLVSALAGTLLSYCAAFITARSPKKLPTMVLHLISLITLSLPGIVLGLSFVMFFHKSMIYGTFIILIVVNIMHFFASPYLMAYQSLLKFTPNLENAAESLGIRKIHMLLDIYIPCTQEVILDMFGYYFANSMVTISAVSFLANFRNMPLALLIPQFDMQVLIEPIAFVSIVILAVNLLVKWMISVLKKLICL